MSTSRVSMRRGKYACSEQSAFDTAGNLEVGVEGTSLNDGKVQGHAYQLKRDRRSWYVRTNVSKYKYRLFRKAWMYNTGKIPRI